MYLIVHFEVNSNLQELSVCCCICVEKERIESKCGVGLFVLLLWWTEIWRGLCMEGLIFGIYSMPIQYSMCSQVIIQDAVIKKRTGIVLSSIH